MTTEPAPSTGRREPLPVRLQRRLADVLAAVAGLALIAMGILISVHILSRWLTGTGVRGANELSQYLMITMVYCGLAMTLREGGFIRLDLVLKHLPRVPRLAIVTTTRLASLGFMVLLTWRTYGLALQSYTRGVSSIGVLRIPLWIPQTIVTVGCAVLTLQVLLQTLWPASGEEASALDEAEAEMHEVEEVLKRADAESLDA